jgi:hypothetical protein
MLGLSPVGASVLHHADQDEPHVHVEIQADLASYSLKDVTRASQGGTGTEVTPGTGELILTGFAPEILVGLPR